MELTGKGRRATAGAVMKHAGHYLQGFGYTALRILRREGPRPRPCPALRDESGQGVAEYVIILAVIVVAAIILAVAFHDKLAAVWQSVTSQLGDLS